MWNKKDFWPFLDILNPQGRSIFFHRTYKMSSYENFKTEVLQFKMEDQVGSTQLVQV